MPDIALGNNQQGRYLLIVNDKNVVEQRQVQPGELVDGGLRIINSGLLPNERVVVGGIMRALPGNTVVPIDDLGLRGCGRDRRPMIAKFFIERPVLANVIALLIVILGIVALYNLPVSQYPDVVPPTVQVTARYPGASAATVAREVALPIEQRVNGVEGMIYMSSLSTSDGQYTLTVTFKIGTDGDKAQILVENRVSSALAVAARERAEAGRADEQEVDVDPRDRRPHLARRALRQPVPVELRDHQPARRDRPPRRRRQRRRVRRRPVRHPHLARSAEAAGARARPAGRDQRRQSAEPLDQRRPGRPAARAARADVPVFDQRARQARRRRRVREDHRQDRQGRPHHPAAGRGDASSSAPSSTARPSSSTASRRPAWPSTSCPTPTRSRSPSASRRA